MNYSFLDFLSLLGAVGFFLYGMKVMSEGLQKVAGDRLRNILSAMTRNRFAGLLTGCAITALIQSSSASTVMVVSFVNAGLMSLAQSMAVIFGANVGTTFTAWIITFFGFKINMSAAMLPLIGVAIIMLFSNSSKWKSIGEFIIGFAFLFMGLNMINDYVPNLQANPEMFAVLKDYASMGFGSILLFVFVGIVVTAIIQSSSAAFAIILVMCSKGWITFELACALVLGSNIGTTITPLIAAMSGNIAAKRAALSHLMFNFLGTLWCMCIFVPFVDFSSWLTQMFSLGDPTALYGFVTGIEQTQPEVYNHLFDGSLPATHEALKQVVAMQLSVSFGLSIFHTVFNIVNVSIMIWLTKVYVTIVEWILPSKRQDDEFSLKFISRGLLNASELNIAQAEKEISVYAERVRRMIDMAHELVHTKEKSEEFNKLYSRLEKYEDISDRMELEIARYLNRCAEGRLSNEGKHRISAMLAIIGEIESIADCCLGIGKILNRKVESKAEFTETIYKNIDTMYKYVTEAMDIMLSELEDLENVEERALIDSYNKEREINNLRNLYRSENIANINSGAYEYQAGIYYMDIVSDLERTGDYVINVVDTVKSTFRRHHSA